MITAAINQKFFGNKPLLNYTSNDYLNKFILKYSKSETLNKTLLYETMNGKFMENLQTKILFNTKASLNELNKLDFLWCPECPTLIVNNKVLNVLNSICSDNYQIIPMQIQNISIKNNFISQDFHIINVLNLVNAIDKKKSKITYYEIPQGMFIINKIALKENCMKSFHLARDNFSRSKILFSPVLARQFINNKGAQFLSDEEASQYM